MRTTISRRKTPGKLGDVEEKAVGKLSGTEKLLCWRQVIKQSGEKEIEKIDN